jgi:hypothetical protein
MASVDVLGRIEGSLQDGGWKASGNVFGDADRLNFYQEIIAWFDFYGDGWEGQPRPAFSGHLLPDPWAKTFQDSDAPFSAFTAQEFMKRGRVQGIYFKDDSTPANDHQINGMQLADIVEHILGKSGEYGHCNLVDGVWPEGFLELDIDATNSTTVAEYEVKEGNFWSRLKEIADIEFYLLYVDKTNTLHYIPHPMFDASLPDPVLTITSDLLLEPLDFDRRHTEQIGQVKLQGTTPAGLQISGKYPTDANPGPVMQRAGYLATSNALMNTIAERMYKFEARDYTITAQLSGAVGLMLDILDRVAVTYTSSGDGITWSSKKFWISKVVVEIMENFTARTTLTMDAENA